MTEDTASGDAGGGIAVLLHSAAPGQLEPVIQHLSSLTAPSSTTNSQALEDARMAHQYTTCQFENDADKKNALATALEEAVKEYLQTTYASSKIKARRVQLTTDEDDASLTISTYVEQEDTGNQNTSFWKGTWTVNSETLIMHGEVQLSTYSYDNEGKNGNVTTCQTTRPFPNAAVKMAEGDESDKAKVTAMVNQIQTWEATIKDAFLADSVTPHAMQQLRQIRRVLPITKTKMKWEVAAQRGIQHLKQTAGMNNAATAVAAK